MNAETWVEHYRKSLTFTISSEAKAYGWTLVIWSTGALLVRDNGLPAFLDILLFVGGAFTGMLITVLLAFEGVMAGLPDWQQENRYAFGAIHLVSVAIAIGTAHLLVALLPGGWDFFFAAVGATIVYQLLLALEVMVSSASDGEDD